MAVSSISVGDNHDDGDGDGGDGDGDDLYLYNHHLPLGGSLTHNSWSLLRPSINSRLGGTCFCKSRSCKLYWCG